MSTLAYFGARPDYALGRAFLLAFAVHAVLIVFMFIGVRMQNRPDETVSVELWEAPPPPPKVEPPKPEPEPEVKKPEIVEKAPPPKPKPKPKPEAKPAPKEDIEKILMREQVALEQEKLNEERRRADEARRKAESEKTARQLAATANSRALGDYINRIRGKVRQNWILPLDIQGTPTAVFEIVQLPTGEVVSVRKIKSSGNEAYDAAVERGILKSSPLPLPEPRSLFDRRLIVTFPSRD